MRATRSERCVLFRGSITWQQRKQTDARNRQRVSKYLVGSHEALRCAVLAKRFWH